MDIKNFKKVKPYQLLIILGVGVFLLIASNFFSASKNKKTQVINEKEQIVLNDIEKRLSETVKKIEGIEDAEVFITYENSGVKRHAANTKDDTITEEDSVSVKKETTVVMKKEGSLETPFVTEEILPEVRGVLIVAKGADNLKLKEEITIAISAVLGVPLHKVRVLPAK